MAMEEGGAWRRGGAARGWCIEAAVTMKREEVVAKLCFHVTLIFGSPIFVVVRDRRELRSVLLNGRPCAIRVRSRLHHDEHEVLAGK